jgi:hypothetical protein
MNKMLLQSKSGTLQTTVELLTTKDFFIEAKYSLQQSLQLGDFRYQSKMIAVSCFFYTKETIF